MQHKILIFIDTFLPGLKGGGPVTSISNLDKMLNQDFEVVICTRNYDLGDKKIYEIVPSNELTNFNEHNVIYLSSFGFYGVYKIIKNFGPDIIYLNSLFSTSMIIVAIINKIFFRCNILIAPRGELQSNALEIKKLKKSIFLRAYKFFKFHKNVIFHSTDQIETINIKKRFKNNSVIELQNPVKIHNFQPLTKNKEQLRIIFISRICVKKNLLLALKVLLVVNHEIIFDIYGPIEDKKYWDKCLKLIDSMPTNIHINYMGSVEQENVVKKMREYHCFFLPTLSENYGHVIVESMQSGLIPLISNKTPWTNLENKNVGWDLSLDDHNKFVSAINTLFNMDDEEFLNKSANVIKYIHKKLVRKKLKNNYLSSFNKIILQSRNVSK